MDMTVVPLKKAPSRKQAQDLIRSLAADGRVAFHPHAKMRKKQRKISSLEVLNCLRTGHVVEEPYQNLTHRGWETAVVGSAAGQRLRIAVCLRWSNDLLVITTYKI